MRQWPRDVRVLEIMPPAVDTAMAGHYLGAKAKIEPVVDEFIRAMLGRRDEVAIGVSQLRKILVARFAWSRILR